MTETNEPAISNVDPHARWKFMRDVLVFESKLALNNLHNFFQIPVTLAVAWSITPPPRLPDGPLPMEIVLWYHVRIYMKVFRALVARETHAGGAASDDALGCAKLALVSIDDSLEALRRLRDAFSKADHDELQRLLTQVRDQLEEKIPGARAYIRVGLDEPVACV